MRNIMKIVIALVGVFVMAGCQSVSIESVREQLASDNHSKVIKAEEIIYKIATSQNEDPQRRIEYVNLTSNPKLLQEIVRNAGNGDVALAAADRLVSTQYGVGQLFKLRVQLFRLLGRQYYKPISALCRRKLAGYTLNELTNYLEAESSWCENVATEIFRRIKDGQEVDAKVIRTLLFLRDGCRCRGFDICRHELVFKDPDNRIFLMGKLSKYNEPYSGSCELKDIKTVNCSIGHDSTAEIESNKPKYYLTFERGIRIVAHIKQPDCAGEIVAAVFNTIAKFRDKKIWNSQDEAKVSELLTLVTKLPNNTIEEAILRDESGLVSNVSEDIVYSILTKGKANECEPKIEIELIKKLPQSKVDLKVLAGVNRDVVKKAAIAAMSDDMRKEARRQLKNTVDSVMNKAKEARKNTFELQGFYLGMDFEDMKLVLSHHFPDYEIKEARDGDGKDSDYVVYIPKQSSPFCYASAKDKKVYQFNFGKSILKKWYKYDVQSFGEWADEYSRETSVSLRYKWINERIEVFRSTLEMMIRGKISLDTHSVTFSQDSYQYRNNAKEYRLIYFGEVKDWAFRDGLGGASDKSSAWEQYIKIGDTPGTLRAKIDKDE